MSVAEALDLSGRLVEDLRQVSRTPKRVCAAAWNSSFENGVDLKGAPSPNEFAKRSLAENTEAMRRWSAGGGVIGASLEALGAEDLDLVEGPWTLPMR